MSKPFLIKDCMHENPIKVQGSASIFDAMKLILDSRVSGLTVVDEENNVIGVISELDCLRTIIGNAYNEGSSSALAVTDFMTTTVDSCGPNDVIVDVAQAMLVKNQRRRPVVQDGKLVGQVSCRNILWAVGSFAART